MKVIIFPHSPAEFSDPYELYSYLSGYLKDRGGNYRIRTDSHLSDIVPKGSFVFFHKTDKLVGFAVVEDPPRAMNNSDYEDLKRESELLEYAYRPEDYDRIIKFYPESIVALKIEHWIHRKLVEEKINKENIYRDYVELPPSVITDILSQIP